MMYWLYEYVHVDNQVDICTLECFFILTQISLEKHHWPGWMEGYEIKYGCYFK